MIALVLDLQVVEEKKGRNRLTHFYIVIHWKLKGSFEIHLLLWYDGALKRSLVAVHALNMAQ